MIEKNTTTPTRLFRISYLVGFFCVALMTIFSSTAYSQTDSIIIEDNKGVELVELKEYTIAVEEEEVFNEPFTIVDEMPEFPGGIQGMWEYVGGNLRYPESAMENGIQGRVILRFVIQPDGAVTDIEVIRSVDPVCDLEAVRVVKGMPNWIPGKKEGKEVPVYFTLPIQFKLTQ